MNNLSKLLDDGTLKVKKINMGKSNKIKTYKKMMKPTKKNKKNRKYSPQIIIKKQSADSSTRSDNKQKIIKRVIDQPKQDTIIKEIDKLVNKDEKQENKKKKSETKKIKGTVDNDKLKDVISPENEEKQVKPKQVKPKQKKTKKKKKTKQYDTQTMIDKLKKKGILVSGKNKKLVKDIYLYALDDQIKIYRK